VEFLIVGGGSSTSKDVIVGIFLSGTCIFLRDDRRDISVLERERQRQRGNKDQRRRKVETTVSSLTSRGKTKDAHERGAEEATQQQTEMEHRNILDRLRW
jgi:Skp family chaperone for outer membrane proteins